MRLLCVSRTLALVSALWIAGTVAANAGELFVDNVDGDDRFDGRSTTANGGQSGPVRTIARALSLIRGNDNLVLRNTGIVYNESIILSGGRFSGNLNSPFRIVGNGAVLDGSFEVPPLAWTPIGKNLWRMTPWRKGHYQLLLDGVPVPNHPSPVNLGALASLPTGHWTTWQGSIYFHSEPNSTPLEQPFRFAALGVGVSMFAVRNVQISDLTLRNFRLDGVNAHDQCRGIELVNVTCTGNGRCGLFVGGSSIVIARGCSLTGNREDSFRVEEAGTADLRETQVNEETMEAAEPAKPE